MTEKIQGKCENTPQQVINLQAKVWTQKIEYYMDKPVNKET